MDLGQLNIKKSQVCLRGKLEVTSLHSVKLSGAPACLDTSRYNVDLKTQRLLMGKFTYSLRCNSEGSNHDPILSMFLVKKKKQTRRQNNKKKILSSLLLATLQVFNEVLVIVNCFLLSLLCVNHGFTSWSIARFQCGLS